MELKIVKHISIWKMNNARSKLNWNIEIKING